jgi:hypothetical protein
MRLPHMRPYSDEHTQDRNLLLLVPGVAGVGGGPDFGARCRYDSVTRVGELNAEDVAGENGPICGGDDAEPPSTVHGVIEGAARTSSPNFGCIIRRVDGAEDSARVGNSIR